MKHPFAENSSVCRFLGALFVGLILSLVSRADAADTLNYQGRVISGGTAFSGSGQFKFALVSADGSTFYWKNDGTTDLAAPSKHLSLTVTKGIFSVRLGDTSLSNMAAIPSSVFSNTSMALRIWFNDGVKGFQQFSPDTSVTSFNASQSPVLEPQVSLDLVSQFSPKFASNSINGDTSWILETDVVCPVEFTVEFYIDGSLKASGSWGSQEIDSAQAPTSSIYITSLVNPTHLKHCTISDFALYNDRSPLIGKKVKWRIFNQYGDRSSREVTVIRN
jgi:hypothetical protein